MSKVVSVGGINIDATITVDRHPRPGEELQGVNLRLLPGGKGANQAVAATRAGAEAVVIGCVGGDSFGRQLIAFLEAEHVDTTYVEELYDAVTGMAFITVDRHGENTIVYDVGTLPRLSFQHPEAVQHGDVLITHFEVPDPTVLDFFREGRRKGTTNIFNAAPQPLTSDLLELVDILVVNEFELAFAAGRRSVDSANREDIATAARAFWRPQHQAMVVTLGSNGAVVFDGDETSWIEARPVTPVDTTGAGDAFIGALAASLSRGESLTVAARYSNASASIAVTRRGGGQSVPFRCELEGVSY